MKEMRGFQPLEVVVAENLATKGLDFWILNLRLINLAQLGVFIKIDQGLNEDFQNTWIKVFVG
jgi:hypothetical protein